MNNNQNFLIGTVEEGITTNTKPWATPKDSWEKLVNMHQWRGRVVKKTPYSQIGQLSFAVVNQSLGMSAQNFTANLYSILGLSGVFIVPHFTVITVNGTDYTLTEDPSIPGNIIQTGGTGVAFLNGSINYLTGALVLNFSSNPGGNVVISFSYAYALPVMGLRTRELFEINEQDTIGFDTEFSYRYSNAQKQFVQLPSVMPTVWSGTNSQFFFTTNYSGAFWATNDKPGLHGWAVEDFAGSAGAGTTATVDVTATGNNVQVGDYVYFLNLSPAVEANAGILAIVTVAGNPFTVRAVNFPRVPANLATTFTWTNGVTTSGLVLDAFQSIANNDGVRYYGNLTNGTGWANYNPPLDINNALAGALLIFPYRGYFIFLNTFEGNEVAIYNYGNRARWTQQGTPYYSFPVPTVPNPQGVEIDAVRDDLFGVGGAADAPTQEVIVGAYFINDILIVRFERSTWRLRYLNNAQDPFAWERINVEFGSDCTFSSVVFDAGGFDVSERGITIANQNAVNRVDDKIPDFAFDIRINNNGLQRVYGIRDFRPRLVYWTIPSTNNPRQTYPDSVLIYNYEVKTWATWDDCFTCFGYFYAFDDTTWGDLTSSWGTYKGLTFGGGDIDAGSETIIAGNQQGFVLNLSGGKLNAQPNQNFQNGASLLVMNITNGTPSVFNSKDNNLPDGSWIVLTGISGTTDTDGTSLNGRSFKVINPSEDADNFTLQEFNPYFSGQATGLNFIFQLSSPYIPIFAGSVNIQVGAYQYVDSSLDGILYLNGVAGGSIDYNTGLLSLNFPVSISPTNVYVRIVSKDPTQGFRNVETTGTYTGGGYISKTSNFIMQSKIFNFLGKDQRSRLSRIDFYTNSTDNGEFTVNIFGDSSNNIINTPLKNNPRSNVVKTTINKYQIGQGNQTMFRLYSNAIAQTIQFNLTLSDQQMAISSINSSDLEVLAMNVSLRSGGRLI